ncbi:hypothetical protein RHSIM_Rhsim05G0116000 [Rhododendron simsii]|uniref:Acyl-CoA N-acyltransferase n=1 Tax=Rhododendron simsii TaxID=118357 RepID=A0A834LP11_RHOSS|nr:hypothetical protein RHSIM_Rhsim05G0116000 [Rhododendron simsii]
MDLWPKLSKKKGYKGRLGNMRGRLTTLIVLKGNVRSSRFEFKVSSLGELVAWGSGGQKFKYMKDNLSYRLEQRRFGKSRFGQNVQNPVHTCKKTTIKALFWGPRKALETPDTDRSLGHFTLTGSGLEGDSTSLGKPQIVFVSAVSSILEVPLAEWDGCNLDSTGPEKFNPFLSHGFLSSLEESGSAVKETGWIPQHIIARDEHKNILGVVPLYLKSHSYGEYVFDHAWADAYYSYGSRYYPKLQCCVPFTPVTGQRFLLRDTPYKDQVFDILVSAMKDLTAKVLMATLFRYMLCLFVGFWILLIPFYASFDEFLMDMKQNKRRSIRQDRKKISAQNLTMKRLRGDEITFLLVPLDSAYTFGARHWDTFYQFYRNTTENKWGSAYLTRNFFHDMGSKLGDNVLLVVAEEGDKLVAGALNLIGGDTLFGRLWGCLPGAYYPSLHFEACYYQAIEAAIELNLDTVEAGAQGEHKVQRGYMPVPTYSCHYIADEGFRKVIEDFLVRETAQVKLVMKLMHESGPFKEATE